MKYTIAVAMVCSLLGACASDHVGVDAPNGLDAGNGRAVTMDEFRRLEGANWEGSLSYLNYGSDKRSTIPVKLAIKVLNEKALQYAIQYPGEDQHNAKERLKLSSDGTRINGYIITNRILPDGQAAPYNLGVLVVRSSAVSAYKAAMVIPPGILMSTRPPHKLQNFML